MRAYVGNVRGPQGKQGVEGKQGIQGEPGAAAGFAEPQATIEELPAGTPPTVEVTASGPDTQKVFTFEFGVPTGIADGSVSKEKLDSALQDSVDKADSAVQPSELEEEQQRATAAEQANDAAIKAEASRAQGAEQANDAAIKAEASRAQGAEQENAEAISAEESRAMEAEQTNATAIANEITRAQAAEQANTSAISAEVTRAKGVEGGLDTRVTEVEGKVPTQASADNQLADKAFVNSSVQTNTANPRGNWDDWAAVPTTADYPADAYGGKTPTVNDYIVVQDASGYPSKSLSGTWRFKYSGTWAQNGKDGWLPEYQVNRAPLTAAQLAALDSGVTGAQVGQIGTNKTDIANIKTKNTEQDEAIEAAQATAETAVQGGTGSSGISVTKEGTNLNVQGVLAETNKLGVSYLHKSSDCTSYSSDNGGATPAAVKKAIIDEESVAEIFNATAEHRGTMSKEDKAKLDIAVQVEEGGLYLDVGSKDYNLLFKSKTSRPYMNNRFTELALVSDVNNARKEIYSSFKHHDFIVEDARPIITLPQPFGHNSDVGKTMSRDFEFLGSDADFPVMIRTRRELQIHTVGVFLHKEFIASYIKSIGDPDSTAEMFANGIVPEANLFGIWLFVPISNEVFGRIMDMARSFYEYKYSFKTPLTDYTEVAANLTYKYYVTLLGRKPIILGPDAFGYYAPMGTGNSGRGILPDILSDGWRFGAYIGEDKYDNSQAHSTLFAYPEINIKKDFSNSKSDSVFVNLDVTGGYVNESSFMLRLNCSRIKAETIKANGCSFQMGGNLSHNILRQYLAFPFENNSTDSTASSEMVQLTKLFDQLGFVAIF